MSNSETSPLNTYSAAPARGLPSKGGIRSYYSRHELQARASRGCRSSTIKDFSDGLCVEQSLAKCAVLSILL
ncbi:hypothetical protein [Capnocytophaga bilenii]|uniref:hypothetical protein n=1 Tax=Capnocytophaga bilenii TaxID=2819369 RepID=UPI0028D3BE89|nr:hypothetical protein [Capnocytophaga bilenii]